MVPWICLVGVAAIPLRCIRDCCCCYRCSAKARDILRALHRWLGGSLRSAEVKSGESATRLATAKALSATGSVGLSMEKAGVALHHQPKPFGPFRVDDGSVPDEDGRPLFHFGRVRPPCGPAREVVDLHNDGGNNILEVFRHDRRDQVVVPRKALHGVDMAVSRSLFREGVAEASRTCVHQDDPVEGGSWVAGHRQVCPCSWLLPQVPWKIAGAKEPLGWEPIRIRQS